MSVTFAHAVVVEPPEATVLTRLHPGRSVAAPAAAPIFNTSLRERLLESTERLTPLIRCIQWTRRRVQRYPKLPNGNWATYPFQQHCASNRPILPSLASARHRLESAPRPAASKE